ncbi:AAA family ATPase [Desulfovibrio sulfodismutans]|uniref:AAA family ATPase n=1 Tax=Desulfolutivibrio sulfodismutans TaxID=63561 RepID=A0A7K3NSS0_9BACT|nr:AAA family ATPase [Desulfolutivibrio sulfodismutans]NDY58289.1 AAA family ATPase [Desulfolutivibrio sulfodismutans]
MSIEKFNEIVLKTLSEIDLSKDSSRMQLYEGLASCFSLIPLHQNHSNPSRNKSPVESGWQRWCHVKRPFKAEDFKGMNAGITGGPSNTLLIIDEDHAEKFNNYLFEKNFSLPETLTIKSGGKSRHFYYSTPSDGKIYKSRTVKDDECVIFDLIGDGRQAVAPGSIHPATGQPYRIEYFVPIAPAPDWLLALSLGGEERKETSRVQEAVSKAVQIDPDTLPRIDLQSMNVPDSVKVKILYSHPKGTRSEVEMSVIDSLVLAQKSDETILSIFEQFPIGEKHREYGQNRIKRLVHQIAVARVFTENMCEAKPIETVTLGDLEVLKPEMEFIIDGLWPKYEPLMILGKGGVGKSLFTLDMLMQLASPPEEGFLGRFKINGKYRSLIFQAENSAASIYRRQQLMFDGKPLPEDVRNNIIFAGEKGDARARGIFSDPQFLSSLSRIIHKVAPDILVFDPLISFHDADENSNQAMRKVLDGIKDFASDLKVTLMVVHHLGKADGGNGNSGGRGASAIGDWNSGSLELKKRKDDLFELVNLKSRDSESLGSLNLRRTPNLRYEIVENEPVKASSKDNTVLAAIHALGGKAATHQELVSRMTDILTEKGQKSPSRNTLRSWITEAIERSIIVEEMQGNKKSLYLKS